MFEGCNEQRSKCRQQLSIKYVLFETFQSRCKSIEYCLQVIFYVVMWYYLNNVSIKRFFDFGTLTIKEAISLTFWKTRSDNMPGLWSFGSTEERIWISCANHLLVLCDFFLGIWLATSSSYSNKETKTACNNAPRSSRSSSQTSLPIICIDHAFVFWYLLDYQTYKV